MSLYLLTFLWGLAGGFSHCIGMCGIFVLSCSGGAVGPQGKLQAAPHALERHLAFHTGRLITLGLLGAITGALGSLSRFAAHYALIQGIVGVSAGVIMILLSLGYVGIFPKLKLPEVDVMGAGGGWGRRLFVRAMQSRSPARPFLLGLLVGFLPCMLTYTVLITAAATLSWEMSAGIMLAFGVGTVPGLLALGLVGGLLSNSLRLPKFRIAMTWGAAAAMLLMAALFIWRALPNL